MQCKRTLEGLLACINSAELSGRSTRYRCFALQPGTQEFLRGGTCNIASDGPTTAGRRKSSHSPRHPRPSNQSSFRPIISALFLQSSRSDDGMSDGVDGRVDRTGSPRLFGLKGRCLVAKLTPSYPYTLQSA